MKKLEQDAFLEALAELFRMQRKHGTVVLTMKRYDGRTKPVPKNKTTPAPTTTPIEYMCLIRAHVTGCGNTKHKISTVVHQKDTVKFQKAYWSLLKSSTDGLKRSKKVKKTKV